MLSAHHNLLKMHENIANCALPSWPPGALARIAAVAAWILWPFEDLCPGASCDRAPGCPRFARRACTIPRCTRNNQCRNGRRPAIPPLQATRIRLNVNNLYRSPQVRFLQPLIIDIIKCIIMPYFL